MPKKSTALIQLILFVLLALCLPQANAAPVCITNSKIGAQLNLPIFEWVNKDKPRKGIIIAAHGLTLYAQAWDKMAKHLANQGYQVYALDQRGFGRWRTESSKFGGTNKIEIEQSQQDLLDLVTTVHQAHPKQQLFCLGESLGSNMILAIVSEHPDLATGAILGSPCYKVRVHPKLRWAEDFAKEVIKPDSPLNLTPYSAPYLTNNPALAQACNADPMIYRKMTPAELVKVDILDDRAMSAAKKLPANFPLLIIAGTKDAMFKQTELPKEIKKFGTQNVSLNLLPGQGHLLMEHQPANPQIASLIDKWLANPSNQSIAIKP